MTARIPHGTLRMRRLRPDLSIARHAVDNAASDPCLHGLTPWQPEDSRTWEGLVCPSEFERNCLNQSILHGLQS